MSEIKELNDLEQLCSNMDILGRDDLGRLVKLETKIIKKLKALEIIKKRFTIQFCKSDLNDYYGIMQIGVNPIYIKTKEEYDLLNEVLYESNDDEY